MKTAYKQRMIESGRRLSNPAVAGSIPAAPTSLSSQTVTQASNDLKPTRSPQTLTQEKLRHELDAAEQKAWDSLGRYKFQMFGYWAAIWVHLNRLGELHQSNPFRDLVKHARLYHGVVVRPDCELLDSPSSTLTQIESEAL